MKRIALIFAVLLLASCTAVENNPVLTIEGGQIQGVKTDIPGVTVYRGIPYAAPPIGELRWKEPQPVVPWDGVKIADTFGHPGFQTVHYPGGYTTEWGYGEESPFSEDCLYLNVWTTAPGKTDEKLPVAYWIHGGGYREGWGSEPEFDGQEFAAKGCVLVSINYRLGIFGFLAHPDLAAESPHFVSGNYGILDQIQGLKWVRENIDQFGGDPDNVTIFGQSAGAGSVRTLCASPLAKGYFNKAIIMSGGGMSTNTPIGSLPLETIQNNNKEILDWAGLTDLQKMRAAGTETLYALAAIYSGATGKPATITGAPIIDNYVSTCSFDKAAIDGTLADVPYMIGFTKDDMGDMSPGIGAFCLNREKAGKPAYAYQFARPLPDDGSQKDYVLKGAFHSSDLWFVFKSLKHCWRPWTKGDWDLAEKEITYWSNFVKYGNPNGPEGGEWSPFTETNQKFMIFKLDENDNEASSMGDPLPGERFTWPPVAPSK
ncbi:MAG: carboxylesterase family protein [Bacteroidales bacterium]|nr:carboxylesterase family protein [Bacteroidales bacterium]